MKSIPKYSVLLFLLLLIVSCGKDEKVEPVQNDPITVSVSEVVDIRTETIIEVPAVLKAKRSALLSFLQGGYLQSAPFGMGDVVDKGDTLAYLDTRALEAAYKQAVAGLAKANRDFQRLDKLRSDGSVSSADYDNAGTALGVAEAAFDAAEFALDHGFIIAPFSGKIAARLYEPGQNIPPGAPVYQIVDAANLEVTAGIAAKFIGLIGTGNKVEIALPYSDKPTAQGEVTGISSAGNLFQGTIPVNIECRNPGRLIPGMSVNLKIHAGEKIKKLIIPAQALRVTSEGETFCYKYRPDAGDVVKTPLTAGTPLTEGIEVLSGLSAGDLVVVSGVEKIRDGDRVKVIH